MVESRHLIKKSCDSTFPIHSNDFHTKKGVEIICNARVSSLNAENKLINSVSLESGESISADMVLVGIGAIPNTQLADSIGLECENGIKTDQYCRTSIPNVLAVGDCTSSFNTLFNKEFRLESVPNDSSSTIIYDTTF